MFEVGQNVLFKMQRCACTGGGFTEAMGKIVGTIDAPNGKWFQIDQPSGIVVVRSDNILKVIE